MRKPKLTKESINISLILILSAVLNFANIAIEGYGNAYYAAGVKSMTLNLKNFFFVAFDPGSFVTIDKPPLGFWVQAIFAKIFGFSGWSILLPQALAGVISVYLIYYLIKRVFGTASGLISALCLAVTPVFVAASRNNTIDNLLVVTLLFACLALTIAAENGKSKFLYLSLILVGIGFNIKMLEAYMIGPAFYITYLLSSTISFKKKIGQLFIGTIILFAVSLSWALIVDMVPPQNRPFIGSSTDNSVLELIIGHNGLERLGIGGRSGRGGVNSNNSDNRQRQSIQNSPANQSGKMRQETPNGGMQGGLANGQRNGVMQAPNGGMLGGQGGPGGMQGSFGGKTPAGVARLFSKNSLSDQIVWFLPIALLGFIAGAIKEKLGFKLDNKRKISLILWFTWLVPEFIYFSFTTGLFHPYYLTMMAPPVAALTGIGIMTMWELYKEGTWKSYLLPAAFLEEGITHSVMLSYYSSNISIALRNAILVGLILCFVAALILIILTFARINKNESMISQKLKLKKILVIIATVGILITPFIGASATIFHSVNSTIPCAGLELLSSNSGRGGVGGGRNSSSANSKLINFLLSNKTNEKYLLVVSSSQSADNIIIQTGEPVMALGGFSGSDNIISLEQFKELVKNGEVRYVLTGGLGRGGSNEIMNWVIQNGKLVPENEYKDNALNNEANEQEIKNYQENLNSVDNSANNKGNSRDMKNNLEPQNKNLNNNNKQSPNLGRQNSVGNNSEQLYDLKDAANTLS